MTVGLRFVARYSYLGQKSDPYILVKAMSADKYHTYDELKAMVVRMGDEINETIKLVRWARECITNELHEGLGAKKLGISDKDLAKLNKLAEMVNSMTNAKIRFDQAQKKLADSMTPDEEKAAVVAYVKSLPDADRAYLIQELKAWHHDRTGRPEGNNGNGPYINKVKVGEGS